jgi:hypothetical protein
VTLQEKLTQHLDETVRDPAYGMLTEAVLGDIPTDRLLSVWRSVFPDCWEFTPTDNDMIRVRHGHDHKCHGDAEAIDITLTRTKFMILCNMFLDLD